MFPFTGLFGNNVVVRPVMYFCLFWLGQLLKMKRHRFREIKGQKSTAQK